MKSGTLQLIVNLDVFANGESVFAVIASVVIPNSEAIDRASLVLTTVPDTDVPITKVFDGSSILSAGMLYLAADNEFIGSVGIFDNSSKASSVAMDAMCESPHPTVIILSMERHILGERVSDTISFRSSVCERISSGRLST